jgi:hypothetical protein
LSEALGLVLLGAPLPAVRRALKLQRGSSPPGSTQRR